MNHIEMLLNLFNFELSNDQQLLLFNNITTVKFEKGDIILLEGESSNNLYFIISGIVRGFYLDDVGNEYTKCFASKNNFCSTECFRSGEAASFSIECIKDCVCLKIPHVIIQSICSENMLMERTIHSFFTQEVSRLEKREKMLLLDDAEKKYASFQQIYPELYMNVPLMYIASFIGIQPSSLSRIRRKQKRSKKLT